MDIQTWLSPKKDKETHHQGKNVPLGLRNSDIKPEIETALGRGKNSERFSERKS